MEDLNNLKRKISQYYELLANTVNYREDWKKRLKKQIISQLEEMAKACGLNAKIEVKDKIENLEAIIFSLGETDSGIFEKINKDVHRHMIKHNGSLVYQQLFNGKVMVMITPPMIEGYAQPQPPRNIAIYRPEEIKPPFLVRHLEELIKEAINWEDYDDDDQPSDNQQIGYRMNFLQPTEEEEEG